MSVNVNRSVSDQFYRYKMPRLIAKVMLGENVCRGNSNTFKHCRMCVDMIYLLKILGKCSVFVYILYILAG